MLRCPHCHTSIVGEGVPDDAYQGTYICPACGQVVVGQSQGETCWFCGKRPSQPSHANKVWLCLDAGPNSQECVVVVPRCKRCAQFHRCGTAIRVIVFGAVMAAVVGATLYYRLQGLALVAAVGIGLWLAWRVSRRTANAVVTRMTVPEYRVHELPAIASRLGSGWRIGVLQRI